MSLSVLLNFKIEILIDKIELDALTKSLYTQKSFVENFIGFISSEVSEVKIKLGFKNCNQN